MDLTLTKDSDLFGFFECECYVPNNVRPMLPYKHKGKTIYP